MYGIDLQRPIVYFDASLRFFKENEYHVSRDCICDVLVLVYEGVLRFSEDGVEYEVHPGQYHIQSRGSYQTASRVSDTPKYLFLHFLGEWTEEEPNLPKRGTFDCQTVKPMLEELDKLYHGEASATEQLALVYQILAALYRRRKKHTVANEIADFIEQEEQLSLQRIADRFHFSKNHIINLFKAEYGMTPIEYSNEQKLKQAERLLEVTSDSVKHIAEVCGFHDYAYFYKLFYRKHKRAPSDWRREKRFSHS